MKVAQKSVDGIPFTNYKARFSGTVFLEEEEAQAASMDEVLVMVVVAKVADVQAKFNRSGELERVNVLKASDARVLNGELKNVLVDRLGLYGEDTVEPAFVKHESAQEESPETYAAPAANVDLDTGEIQEEDIFVPQSRPAPESEWEPFEDRGFPSEGPVELGSINQRDPRAIQEGSLTRGGGTGPKVKPFHEEDAGAAVPAGEVIGRVGRPGVTTVRNWGEEVPDRG